VIDALNGTENGWLAQIIFTFNTGNIPKWNEIKKEFAPKLDAIPAFIQKHELLEKKIALMSLVDLSFRKISVDRNIPFKDISEATHLPTQEVEMLVMRALSLGLLKGSIDQIEQYFSVTWVQPRILKIPQINEMGGWIEQWTAKVKNTLTVMESGMTSELVS